jgi:catechol 2,3-dioxygenase-like lactoylglutathione lyase family enzyme
MIQTIAFVAYAVKDLGVSRHFYEDLLGLKLTQSPNEDWFEYDLGGTTFVLTSADAEHPAPVRGGLVAFEVSDLDAEVSRLRKLGVTFNSEVAESPICRYALVLDPDGSEILIHKRKTSA